jgi:class 3 adenylate cyclase
MDLAQWLAELGLGQYAAAFTENDIDFDVLVQLTDADLKELGVSSLGNRKRLLAAIAARAPVSPVPVSPADISKGERRQVTILFADLCGFTALAQSLDPEEVRELVARYTALLDGIVVSYGATVDKHIGDAVMALFGAPKAHDDDPLRAARAALDIHDAVEQLTDSRGRPLRAHVGVASGEVVAGSLERGSAHDYTVLVDSVNLAARLVAAAGPAKPCCQILFTARSPAAGFVMILARSRSKASTHPRASGACALSRPIRRRLSGLPSLGAKPNPISSKASLPLALHAAAARSCMSAAKRELARRDWWRKCAGSPKLRVSPRIAARCSISEWRRDMIRYER